MIGWLSPTRRCIGTPEKACKDVEKGEHPVLFAPCTTFGYYVLGFGVSASFRN